MKKLTVVALALALLSTAYVMAAPVGAESEHENPTLYKAEIIDVNLLAGDSIRSGEALIKADGSIKVKIKGARPSKPYMIRLNAKVDEVSPFMVNQWFPVWTDASGNFVFTATLNNDNVSLGEQVLQPNLIVQRNVSPSGPPNWVKMFQSGFVMP